MPQGTIGGKCNMFGWMFQSLEIIPNIGEGEKTGKREDGKNSGEGRLVIV